MDPEPTYRTERPIRFVLNGRPVAVDGAPPSTMLLEWLRTVERATGTKEGCAEGDCGACTVVLVRRAADGGLRVEPCNACIRPLASVDGCGVLTVEGLAGAHPAQRELVGRHGSQCGFCTPGFVTAIAARLAAGPVTTDAQAHEALAGNLCRCTGYRPIVESLRAASDALHAAPVADGGPPAGLPAWVAALPPPDPTPLASAGGGARWIAPRRCDEVDAALAASPQAWLVAGATDVGLWVTKQLREPRLWIALGAIDALRRVTVDDAAIDVGAAVSLADAFAALDADYPELAGYWSRFASPAIRASGTLVGNLANGSPIGDAAPVLIALGAVVVVRGADGGAARRREVPLDALYRDYRVQDRAPHEWIERVRVPRRPPGRRVAAWKLAKRREQDIAAVSVGVAIDGSGRRIDTARIAFGGMAATVRRAPAAEAVLAGAAPSPEAFARAGEALAHDFSPLDDLRASRAYRLEAAAGLLLRTRHVLYSPRGGVATVFDPSLDELVERDRR